MDMRQLGHRKERSSSCGPNDFAIVSHISSLHRGQTGRLWSGYGRSSLDMKRPLYSAGALRVSRSPMDATNCAVMLQFKQVL